MKINLRSNQNSLIIYQEKAEAFRYAIKITVFFIGTGFLCFWVGVDVFLENITEKEHKVIIFPLVLGNMFLVFGIPMAICLPGLLAKLKKDNGAVILIANKEGLSITTPVEVSLSFNERISYYTWNNIEKILLTRKASTDHLGWDLMIIYLRDDPERKNKSLLERDIWRKKKEKIYLPGFSNEQMDLVRTDLSQLSCQNVKILYDKSSA